MGVGLFYDWTDGRSNANHTVLIPFWNGRQVSNFTMTVDAGFCKNGFENTMQKNQQFEYENTNRIPNIPNKSAVQNKSAAWIPNIVEEIQYKSQETSKKRPLHIFVVLIWHY